MIKNTGIITTIIIAILSFSSVNTFADLKTVCDNYKTMGGGYSSSITSVVCNQPDHSHTITLMVQHTGCSGSGCPAISSYAVQAAPGTYSNVTVSILYGGINFTNINMGPALNGETFDGFRIEGISGIGNGNVGVFTVTYNLTGPLQAQQVAAHANDSVFTASFLALDFQNVMSCYQTNCSGGGLIGPTANNDSAATPKNSPVTIDVLANDVQGSGALVPSSVSFISGTEPNAATVGVFSINHVNGAVTFTPDTNYTGPATIYYQVCDVNSLCSSAKISVNVNSGSGCPGDQDCDGCPDDVDDYPNDPTRCFNNPFPASGNGTLAFEDLWPSRGDYDFNDVVLDYHFTTVTNSSNKVVEIFGKFILKASGSFFHNGFGFQIPTNGVDPSTMTVTGYHLQHNLVTLNSHGLENGQSKPTIIVFDDFFDLMPWAGGGAGVNTDPGASYVTPDTILIHITFSSPLYLMSQTNIENFNPFIITDQRRGYEIHLPDYPPTNLADQSVFGTFEDRSNPSAGKYYKTENNLPWAINIYESFAYTKSGIDIIDAYNHFVDWASSGGTLYPDWYQDKPGYRNASNIYMHP
jgi:LruC domain-containing protein